MNERFIARLHEVKFAKAEGETVGRFEGYGAIFGTVDSYGDVIAPGAFKASLRAWKQSKRLPPMLLQHAGYGPNADDWVPCGIWDEMAEDEKGLYVRGHLIALDTDRGKCIYAAMLEGGLDGLSIGYRAKEFAVGTKPGEPERTLKAVDLVEVSIVTFPANAEARVEAVKAGAVLSERECERILRDAGFSRQEAKTIVAKGYRALQREADESAILADIVSALRAGTSILQER